MYLYYVLRGIVKVTVRYKGALQTSDIARESPADYSLVARGVVGTADPSINYYCPRY